MSRRGRYRKFGPEFQPEPWYTDGSDSDTEFVNDLNESITDNNPREEAEVPVDSDLEEARRQSQVLLEALGHHQCGQEQPLEQNGTNAIITDGIIKKNAN